MRKFFIFAFVCILLIAMLAAGNAGAASCTEIAPDFQYRCRGNPVKQGYNLSFVSLTDNSLMGANANDPHFNPGRILGNALMKKFQWATRVASVSPGLNAILTARTKNNCPAYDPRRPNVGKTCSYGNTTLWLDTWEPDTKTWLHTNLNHYYGYNSEAHGWATWLYHGRGLFNVLVRRLGAPAMSRQEDNNPQIYSVDFTDKKIRVEKFAPAQLEDANCLTGRVTVMPNLKRQSCFDGQRLAFVRRCYAGERMNAWWNNTRYSGSGKACPGINAPSLLVPVLRTYVVELDASCTPKKSWGHAQSARQSKIIAPARTPPDSHIYRQMGAVAEWGDMLSAISPDGNYLAVATTMGPSEEASSCSGFQYVLQDPENPVSGNSSRRVHWCRLEKSVSTGQITCAAPMEQLTGDPFMPPPSTLLPTFLPLFEGYGLLYSTHWAQQDNPQFLGITRSFFEEGYDQYDRMFFGTEDGNDIFAAQAIYH